MSGRCLAILRHERLHQLTKHLECRYILSYRLCIWLLQSLKKLLHLGRQALHWLIIEQSKRSLIEKDRFCAIPFHLKKDLEIFQQGLHRIAGFGISSFCEDGAELAEHACERTQLIRRKSLAFECTA